MKLFNIDTSQSAKDKMNEHFKDLFLEIEEIHITSSLGRTLCDNIYSPVDLPEFDRSTVDGYAVIAKDTYGASSSIPTFLELKGSIGMGTSTHLSLDTGQTVYVPTGGMLPLNSDGVVMIEYTEELDSNTILVNTSIAPGDGVIRRSEDIKKGELILKKGRIIRPQDIGALAGVGIEKVKVFKKVKVTIISTGDEIVDPFSDITLGQIRDINSYALASISLDKNLEVVNVSIIKDDFDLLRIEIESNLKKSDIIIISGGSSVGTKDMTANVINSFQGPGVFVHGIAIKPGKPTIIGKINNTAVFGLPGHPVSAIMVYKVFIEYLINRLNQIENELPLEISAKSHSNIHTSPGKDTYQMVSIEEIEGEYIFKPVYGKSGSITLLTKAQGYIEIKGNREGILRGDIMKVKLL